MSKIYWLCPLLLVYLFGACGQPTTTAIPSSTPLSPTVTQPSNRTKTGFYWPTGREVTSGNWLEDSCGTNNNYYEEDHYHIGVDIPAILGDQVYAIADGKVLWRSLNGWGSGNVGLLIEHKLLDGTPFLAVYGHVISELKIGEMVEAGHPIATIGPWAGGTHLHFGTRYDTSNKDPYGMMPCEEWDATNGFENPLEWITLKSPGLYSLLGTITPLATITHTPPAPVPALTRRPTPTSTIIITPPRISYIGSDGNVWLMQSDGSDKRRLTELTNPKLAEYSWSPDGSKLAFLNYETGQLIPYLLDLSMDVISRLTDLPIAATGLTWSPDGKYIAFPTNIQTNTDIYSISVVDKTVRSLTNKPGSDYYRLPAWSPDGRSVAFVLGEDIYLLDVGDSSIKNLTAGKYHIYSIPSWSRDGNYIGFIAKPVELGICFEGVCDDLRYYLILSDGSQVIDLESSYGVDGIPSWSPDGSSVIYVSDQDGNQEVYRVSADWSNKTNLTQSPGNDMAISWSPDGRMILFTSDRNGNTDIYRMNFDGSDLVNLTNSSEDETAPQWQPVNTLVIKLPSQPESTPSPDKINFDPTNPDDVILWFSTGLKQSNPDIFATIFTEDTLLYGTGMAMEGGSDEISKDAFLQELAKRLPSQPTCIAYTVNSERTLLMIWTEGWQPKWDLIGQPTSEVLTFSLSLQDGDIYTTAYFTPDPAILNASTVKSIPCP